MGSGIVGGDARRVQTGGVREQGKDGPIRYLWFPEAVILCRQRKRLSEPHQDGMMRAQMKEPQD